jgi:hypothetical protein
MDWSLIIFIFVLAFFAYRGYKKGLLKSLSRVLSLIAGYVVAILYAGYVSKLVESNTPLQGIAAFVAASLMLFIAAGIAVTVVGSFYEESDFVVGKIDRQSILQATLSVGQAEDCDGVFISCTSLRAADIIEEAEQILNKPVTASNHALAWHLLRLADIDDRPDGLGQLFRTSLPNEKAKQ